MTWPIRTCNVTSSYGQRVPFTWVPWPIHMCDVSRVCVGVCVCVCVCANTFSRNLWSSIINSRPTFTMLMSDGTVKQHTQECQKKPTIWKKETGNTCVKRNISYEDRKQTSPMLKEACRIIFVCFLLVVNNFVSVFYLMTTNMSKETWYMKTDNKICQKKPDI